MSISGKTPATSLIGSITLTTKKTAFIQFDIKEFFPSITEEIVGGTITPNNQTKMFWMKMLYTRVGTSTALNTQIKPISTTVRKEPETSYGLIHHFLKL